jgi:hypothetical protein
MLIAHPAAPMVRARKLADTGSVMLLVAVVAIVASAARQHIAGPAMEAVSAGLTLREIADITLMNATLALPSFFLILALLSLRAALQECFFTKAAGAALRHAGAWALGALAAKIVLAPTLYGLFELQPISVIVTYESFDLGMIGFAALLMLAGSVIETATSRSDEIA